MTQQPVFTIGHSTRSVDEVVRMLRHNGVTGIADIRSFPGSRTNPQWGQEALVDALPGDIDYRWIRALGGRRYARKDGPSANAGWRVNAFRAYADYMGTPEFEAGLAELADFAAERRVALLCSEAVPWRCHRRLVTDALLVRGVRVAHIMSENITEPASLTPFARVDETHLSYPAEPSGA